MSRLFRALTYPEAYRAQLSRRISSACDWAATCSDSKLRQLNDRGTDGAFIMRPFRRMRWGLAL
jgi:putative component of membrane protein insertase Oxa1/YidC/SpoIIIJ protein YidD